MYFTILVKLCSIFKQSVLQLSVLAAVRPWTASSLAVRGRNEGRGASGGGTLDGAASVFSVVCHANGRQAFDNVEDRCMSDISSSSSLKQPRVASRLHQLAVAARGVALAARAGAALSEVRTYLTAQSRLVRQLDFSLACAQKRSFAAKQPQTAS